MKETLAPELAGSTCCSCIPYVREMYCRSVQSILVDDIRKKAVASNVSNGISPAFTGCIYTQMLSANLEYAPKI